MSPIVRPGPLHGVVRACDDGGMVFTLLVVLAAWIAGSMVATALWGLAAGGTRQTETSLLTGFWPATVRASRH